MVPGRCETAPSAQMQNVLAGGTVAHAEIVSCIGSECRAGGQELISMPAGRAFNGHTDDRWNIDQPSKMTCEVSTGKQTFVKAAVNVN